MFANLTGWHMLVVVFIILLLFGAPKLPALAKSLGQSMHILKKEVRSTDDPVDGDEAAARPTVAETGAGTGATSA
ncbi:sec-independent protein translocase protein TatA [Agromyces hippuratus]|uniref:Sec-independent protein translocase protein TatA n=1 Tax=Agromyces hippuratus TaxID=286438 RepID=A0A852WTP7_9MICO|nr:twin-arginine translocase TatA/TatE family subunit [Agromyces hippuratus]NYG21366.1 sec-independent protein translocase protein TatA [Agromyces hippuratus]